jgi:hypothetical protein
MNSRRLFRDDTRLQCCTCRWIKDKSAFSKNKNLLEGLAVRCKDCCKVSKGGNPKYTRCYHRDSEGITCKECDTYKPFSDFHKGMSVCSKCRHLKTFEKLGREPYRKHEAFLRVDETHRKCSECHIIKHDNEFPKGKVFISFCKKCKRQKQVEWYKKNPEKAKAIFARARPKQNLKQNIKCKNLDDSYVKSKIVQSFGLSTDKIPQVLIETKRAFLKLRREIKDAEEKDYENV